MTRHWPRVAVYCEGNSSAVLSRQQGVMRASKLGLSQISAGLLEAPHWVKGWHRAGAQDTCRREQDSLPGPVDSGRTFLMEIP